MSDPDAPGLLAIIEQGGYPDFKAFYASAGYRVTVVTSVRKALAVFKKHTPAVVVAEFNYQSDFRDRTSSLESLLAVIERQAETRVIVFYEKQTHHQLERLQVRFPFFTPLPFPVDADRLRTLLDRPDT